MIEPSYCIMFFTLCRAHLPQGFCSRYDSKV
jgi:hypothetical protein